MSQARFFPVRVLVCIAAAALTACAPLPQTPPSRVRSRNMEAAIEIITLEEITKYLQG